MFLQDRIKTIIITRGRQQIQYKQIIVGNVRGWCTTTLLFLHFPVVVQMLQFVFLATCTGNHRNAIWRQMIVLSFYFRPEYYIQKVFTVRKFTCRQTIFVTIIISLNTWNHTDVLDFVVRERKQLKSSDGWVCHHGMFVARLTVHFLSH